MYTKAKVLLKFGSYLTVYVEISSKKGLKLSLTELTTVGMLISHMRPLHRACEAEICVFYTAFV